MFDIDYVGLFTSLPPEIAVMLIAFIPIAELRVSIPIALAYYKMSVPEAIFWSALADIIISAVIIYSLNPIYNKLTGKLKIIDRFFIWLFRRTRKKFFRKYEVWGNLALALFVAIPLPVTGAWTGSIASWLFDIPKSRSLFYISLGVIISAGIVTLISLGVFSIFKT
ncbi:MAG: ligand-binding protein SH3 [Actinobacteria bacterium]|nr:ligand-binding protein SH3 [Actinomycetota bacterium]